MTTTPPMTDPEAVARSLSEAQRDDEKRCFTYCGDDHCNCPAREAHSLLGYISPALPVLSAALGAAGLPIGKAKANEMIAAVRAILETPNGQD